MAFTLQHLTAVRTNLPVILHSAVAIGAYPRRGGTKSLQETLAAKQVNDQDN